MATYTKRVESLDGTHSNKSEDWEDGYRRALLDAVDVTDEADDVVAELVELIDDILNGYRKLADWATAAETTVGRLKARARR